MAAFDFAQVHKDPNQPDYWHPHYRKIKPTLEYLTDMYEGRRRWLDDEGAVIDGEKAYYYLPKSEAQEDAQYVQQLRASVFRGFFKQVIDRDLSTLLLDFQLNDDARWFEEYQNDVDLLGNSLKVFLQQMVQAALRDGSSFCLVNSPTSNAFGDEKPTTLADEASLPLRPYLVFYRRDQVVNWRWINTPMGPVLGMVVLKSEVTRPDGDFGHQKVIQYLVLYADGRFDIYEAEEQQETNTEYRVYTSLQKVRSGRFEARGIPLVGLSLTSNNTFTADFPLLEIADLTLDYYRVRSGYRMTLDYMKPTLFAREVQNFAMNESSTPKQLKVGANAVIWNLEETKWIEPAGTGIAPDERCLQAIEDQIRSMTMAFFTGGTVAKTATEVELDASQAEAALSGYAYYLESAVQQIFRHFAYYLGFDDEAGSITVMKNLVKRSKPWQPKDILEWIATGVMSREMGFAILRDLDLLPEDLSLEDFDEEVTQTEEPETLDNPEMEDSPEDNGMEDMDNGGR